MRANPTLALAALLGLAMLGACAQADPTDGAIERPSATETPSASPEPSAETPTGEVYVLDLDTFEGDDGQELSLQEPEKLTLSEFSSASDLQWEAWGGASALATGRIFGNFCASDCAGDAYLVTLVLCEIEGDHYRKFGIFGDFPEFDDGEWAFGGPLYVGAQAVPDGEWSNGCAEPQPEDLTGQ